MQYLQEASQIGDDDIRALALQKIGEIRMADDNVGLGTETASSAAIDSEEAAATMLQAGVDRYEVSDNDGAKSAVRGCARVGRGVRAAEGLCRLLPGDDGVVCGRLRRRPRPVPRGARQRRQRHRRPRAPDAPVALGRVDHGICPTAGRSVLNCGRARRQRRVGKRRGDRGADRGGDNGLHPRCRRRHPRRSRSPETTPCPCRRSVAPTSVCKPPRRCGGPAGDRLASGMSAATPCVQAVAAAAISATITTTVCRPPLPPRTATVQHRTTRCRANAVGLFRPSATGASGTRGRRWRCRRCQRASRNCTRATS